MKDNWIKKLMILLLVVAILQIKLVSSITDSNLSNNAMNVTINVRDTVTHSFKFVHYAEDTDDVLNTEFGTYDELVEEQSRFISDTFPIGDETPFIIRNESDPVLMNDDLRPQLIVGGSHHCNISRDLAHQSLYSSSINASITVGIISEQLADRFAVSPLFGTGSAGWRCPLVESVVVVTEKTGEFDNKITTAAHEAGHMFGGLCDEYRTDVFRGQDDNNTPEFGGCPNGDQDENGELDNQCTDTYGVEGLMGCPINDENLVKELFFQNQEVEHLVNMYGSRDGLDNNRSRRWIDNRSYSHLVNEFEGAGKIVCTDELIIIISGSINKLFNLSMGNFYTVQGGCYYNKTFSFNSTNSSVLQIEQKDSGGGLLNFLKRVFTFGIMEDGGDFIEVNSMPLVLAMPFDNQTASIVFMDESNESIASRNVTPNTPNITIESPSSGEIFNSSFNVTWSASDADNDTIFYAILISNDNGTSYATVAYDLNQTFYEIDNSNYAFGSDYKIKILATDGVNTGTDISNGTFTIVPPPSIEVNNISLVHRDNNTFVFHITLKNDGGQVLSTGNAWNFWSDDGGDFSSNYDFPLDRNEEMELFIEYLRQDPDLFRINITANNTGFNITDSEMFYIDPPSIDIQFQVLYQNASRAIFEITMLNNGERSLTDAKWNLDTGLENITSNDNITMTINEEISIFIEYEYPTGGEYNTIATGTSDKFDITDTQNLNIIAGDLIVHALTELYSQTTLKIYEFKVSNNLDTNINDVSWSFDTGENLVTSDYDVNLTANESMTVIFEHNYTNSENYTITANATNGSITGSDSISTSVN